MPWGCFRLREEKSYNTLGDITDKYEIGQLLRTKEFCELCLARERRTDQLLICKRFLKKDGRKVRQAARNEILILKMVSHPNILQLIDTFETRKEFYIIQELATGGDVFDWILDLGCYTEKDASSVVRQVLEALAYLHSLHIVHRNLKLENLVYHTQQSRAKVMLRDFCLSRFENGAITEPCGTPEYLAPEVIARQRYGRPVDCWAVGVILFILLSGNPPFYDDVEQESSRGYDRRLFRQILTGEYSFDPPYWDDISPAAKKLVSQLLEVDQDQRITAQEALGHIWVGEWGRGRGMYDWGGRVGRYMGRLAVGGSFLLCGLSLTPWLFILYSIPGPSLLSPPPLPSRPPTPQSLTFLHPHCISHPNHTPILTAPSTSDPGPDLAPQDCWQCGIREEPQGGSLCPDQEELCQSQMAGEFP
uniref:Protein kinase domain-containing protein n=1 Tax=Pelusios castaneus TaxID=367368 RepID=A0A8C8VFJ7_9SAUR